MNCSEANFVGSSGVATIADKVGNVIVVEGGKGVPHDPGRHGEVVVEGRVGRLLCGEQKLFGEHLAMFFHRKQFCLSMNMSRVRLLDTSKRGF